jgi:biopolymer transport protein ExbB
MLLLDTTTAPELSLWSLCLDGGWIMIVLAVLLVVCIYVFIERAIVIGSASRQDDTFMQRIKDYIHEGEIESAENLCRSTNSPYSRLIAKGISRIGRPMSDVLVTIENTGNIEVSALSKGFTWLATIAAAAPMIGFLGTVIGMVESFYARHKSATLPAASTPPSSPPLPVSLWALWLCLHTTTSLAASTKL